MAGEEDEIEAALTVDLSRRALKRIERANNEHKNATVLIISDNEISKLDNLESYANLKKLSLVNNQVVRMYGVAQLIHLEFLDLRDNLLVTIEGLKELKNLKELYLGRNKIKVIEHLNNNLNLEMLDLSENNIAHISDISHLKLLRGLYLHGNKLIHLRQCERYFPDNIEVLTLHNNLICDLNEVSHLMQFSSMRELTFAKNPCVDFVNSQQAFNYRPFIKNWCSSLMVLDEEPLDDIECLKAEWLYSQGRGRSFKIGEQGALVEYLTSVCPPKEPNDETEDLKKLKLILSKAQQHQKQLKEQISTGIFNTQNENKISKKKKLSGLPERMVTSYQDVLSKNRSSSPDIMTRSLDSGIRKSGPNVRGNRGEPYRAPLQTSTTFIPIPDSLISPDVCHKGTSFISSPARPASLSSRTSKGSSRNSPHSTPENKRKPSKTSFKKQNEYSSPLLLKKTQRIGNSRSSTPLESYPLVLGTEGNGKKDGDTHYKGTSDDEDHDILNKTKKQKQNKKFYGDEKIKTSRIEPNANEKIKISNEMRLDNLADGIAWKAAVCIQRRWRGYRARNLNRKVLAVCKDIQLSRIQEYITEVINEMEATRTALEGNRKLQMLQMQAINAIWKKILAFPPKEAVENINENALTLQQLMTTCSNLNKQVEGLQSMMKTFQLSQIPHESAPMATQTEIVAVHTPQGVDGEVFRYFTNVPKAENHKDAIEKNFALPLNSGAAENFSNKEFTEEQEANASDKPSCLKPSENTLDVSSESALSEVKESNCPLEESDCADVKRGKVF